MDILGTWGEDGAVVPLPHCQNCIRERPGVKVPFDSSPPCSHGAGRQSESSDHFIAMSSSLTYTCPLWQSPLILGWPVCSLERDAGNAWKANTLFHPGRTVRAQFTPTVTSYSRDRFGPKGYICKGASRKMLLTWARISIRAQTRASVQFSPPGWMSIAQSRPHCHTPLRSWYGMWQPACRAGSARGTYHGGWDSSVV